MVKRPAPKIMLENYILFSWENRTSKEQTWLVTCSAKMKEGKMIAPNRLVENCTLYLVLHEDWKNKRYKTESDFQENGKHGPSERSSPLWSPWERPWLGGYQRFVPLSLVKFHDSLPIGERVFSIIYHFPSLSLSWVSNFVIFKTIFTQELILSTFTVVKQ